MEDLNKINFIIISKLFKYENLFKKHNDKLESITKKT